MQSKKTSAAASEKDKSVQDKVIRLRPIRFRCAEVRIVGDGSPLVHHKWDEKMQDAIRMKKEKGDKPGRTKCDPEAEFEAATYRLKDGRPAIPFSQIKNAMVEAAHKETGIEKTRVRKAVRFVPDEDYLIAIDGPGPKMREDIVRVPPRTGNGDLRYRPEYTDWSVRVRFDYDSDLITIGDILNLLERAGFGVGLGEWRPEKDGDWGRFEIDRKSVKDSEGRWDQ